MTPLEAVDDALKPVWRLLGVVIVIGLALLTALTMYENNRDEACRHRTCRVGEAIPISHECICAERPR